MIESFRPDTLPLKPNLSGSASLNRSDTPSCNSIRPRCEQQLVILTAIQRIVERRTGSERNVLNVGADFRFQTESVQIND
jgi:hypothetical protein